MQVRGRTVPLPVKAGTRMSWATPSNLLNTTLIVPDAILCIPVGEYVPLGRQTRMSLGKHGEACRSARQVAVYLVLGNELSLRAYAMSLPAR